MRLTVVNHLTLDGVMQAPASADEDTSGGFAHGGWAVPYQDEVMGKFMGARINSAVQSTLLFGRRTYEHMYSYWPKQTGPVTDTLNRAQKYVASNTLRDPLEWENSTLLTGDDVAAQVRALDLDAVILGSGRLIHTLLREDMIDAFVLTLHPLVLGSGLRLFPDDGLLAKFRLVESIPTTTGVIIAVYER
jgi:dihydrofolate reductase